MATLNIKNFPDELYEKLKRKAKESQRSVAQEVTNLLSKSVGLSQTRSVLELRGLGAHIWKDIDTTTYIEEGRDAWE